MKPILVTQCMYCRRVISVRASGAPQVVDDARTDVDTSHGVCDGCARMDDDQRQRVVRMARALRDLTE